MKAKTLPIIMLPTDKPAQLHIEDDGLLSLYKKEISFLITKAQHLYIISNDVIKANTWVYNTLNNCIIKGSNGNYYDKKIEATTDKDLNLPLIHYLFLKSFVKLKGKVKHVNLELDKHNNIKIYPDNTIKVIPSKMYTQLELENFIRLAWATALANKYSPKDLNVLLEEFIENNT